MAVLSCGSEEELKKKCLEFNDDLITECKEWKEYTGTSYGNELSCAMELFYGADEIVERFTNIERKTTEEAPYWKFEMSEL